MKTKYIIPILLILLSFHYSCKDEKKPMVDLDQINFDGSTNDKYLFREEIKKEKFRKNRYHKENF